MTRAKAAFALKQTVVAVALCLCAFEAAAEPDAPAAVVGGIERLTVYPQVSVNGSLSDGLYPFIEENGRLFADSATFAALGITVPPEALETARARTVSQSTTPPDPTPTAAAGQAAGGEASLPPALPGAALPAESSQQKADKVSDGLQTDAAAPSDAVPDIRPSENRQDPGHTAAAPDAADGRFALSELPQLQTAYNSAAQTLALTVPVAWLNRPLTRIGAQQDDAYGIARPGYAAVLNYDYNHTRSSGGERSQGILAEARFSTPAGYLSHNHMWNEHHNGGSGRSQTARLDTYWRSVWAEKGLAFTAGDITGSSSARLGGVKIERSYSVQPWRNTAPLRNFIGSATLPSTIDLYLNGVKQYSREVEAGGYELILPPTVSGRGMAQVVATDVLGRTVVVDMPLYGGSGLLAKGLREWSLEAGYLRKDYGIKDFSYHKQLAGSGAMRMGLTDFLTARFHAEGGGSYRRFGAAATAVLGAAGQLDLSYAQSRFKETKGSLASAFFSTGGKKWSAGLGYSQSSGGYTGMGVILSPDDFAAETLKTHTGSVSAGYSSDHLGSFNAAFVHSKSGTEPADKIATLSWNRNFGRRTGASLSASRNFNGSGQTGVYGSLSVSLDKGYAFNLGAHRDVSDRKGYHAGLNKSGNGLGSPSWGIGWERDSDGSTGRNRVNGHFSLNTQYGDLRSGVYSSGGQTNYNAGWRGGLVFMSGGLFAARHVYDSFAVVDTGTPGVPVTLSDTRVGNTNRKGLLLVPNLLAYQKNRIGIDITGLPYDMKADRTKATAVPSEKSGVAVSFALSRMHAAALTLKTAQGAHIESGSMIHDEQGRAAAVVGFDGQSFIEDMKTGINRFSVERAENGGRCRFEINYQAAESDGLQDLGETVCQD